VTELQIIFDKGGSLHVISVGGFNATYPSQEVVVGEGMHIRRLFKKGQRNIL
jgi:hypothetical protein